MSFGKRIQEQREQLGLSQAALARRLGVSQSTVGNYEAGISFPKEEVLLRLFDCLETDPNALFRDSFRGGGQVLSRPERQLLERYRALPPAGRETLRSVSEALCAFRDEMARSPEEEPRVIPLYRSPAAAGYAAPVFGEDIDSLSVQWDVPPAAEFAVRVQGDSMEPWLRDGGVAYVNHDPLRSGDAGIFCVDGEMFCKQYYRDPLGMVYLFSLNRARADAAILLPPESGRSLVCLGRVMLHTMPLPGKDGE